jgi:hypothetical protein
VLPQPNTGVGYLGSVYTPSYYNNQPAVAPAQADSFIPLATQSEAFCVGAVSGKSAMVKTSARNSLGVFRGIKRGCLYRG